MSKELTEAEMLELERPHAYHEAGHAAIKFMFGTHHNIVHIDMAGSRQFCATTRSVELNVAGLVRRGTPRSVMEPEAKMQMMFNLAGFAAESRVEPSLFANWLEEQTEMAEWNWSADDQTDPHDMARAFQIAKALRADNRNAWKLLREMAQWTDEALAYPRLWAVVVALAEHLATAKRRVSGERACKIMDGAWGEGTLPYIEMGPKWRQRFSIPHTPENQP